MAGGWGWKWAAAGEEEKVIPQREEEETGAGKRVVVMEVVSLVGAGVGSAGYGARCRTRGYRQWFPKPAT
jgi:hypothetical protein